MRSKAPATSRLLRYDTENTGVSVSLPLKLFLPRPPFKSEKKRKRKEKEKLKSAVVSVLLSRLPVMAKEFTVRPVIFPSSTPSTPYHRRPGSSSPPPPFQPAPRSSTSLPFVPFDIPSTSSAPPLLYSGIPIASSSSGYFEDEPPLLEELGINTRQIWRKTVSILNPIRSDPGLHEDGDLSGPFMFLLSFGLFQLLAGKFYFGIVLGKILLSLDI
jgi:hypothetical protein